MAWPVYSDAVTDVGRSNAVPSARAPWSPSRVLPDEHEHGPRVRSAETGKDARKPTVECELTVIVGLSVGGIARSTLGEWTTVVIPRCWCWSVLLFVSVVISGLLWCWCTGRSRLGTCRVVRCRSGGLSGARSARHRVGGAGAGKSSPQPALNRCRLMEAILLLTTGEVVVADGLWLRRAQQPLHGQVRLTGDRGRIGQHGVERGRVVVVLEIDHP